MLKLFQKKPKVKQGKQTQADASAQNKQEKKQAPLAAFGKTWKKLNSMDRKQAYTWGAVVLVGVVGLLILASAASGDQDDFSDFETRGYDLANMPFSSDEAEQYLLASKYPDMEEGNKGMGLYSEEEKEARQEEDAAQAELDTSASSTASEYVGGRYYGGGSGRVGPRTKVGSLNSASVKGASGSGLNSKFGPTGDFSNFRSQNRGNDKAPGRGTGDARKALQQTARASRAAAGLKNDKMLNAKKALMGGSVDGSKAFMDDSGAVNLGEAAGLELDTNAPVSSADLSGLDQGLNDAKDQGQKDAGEKEQEKWWKEMLVEVTKEIVQGAVKIGLAAAQNSMNTAIADARQTKALDEKAYADTLSKIGEIQRLETRQDEVGLSQGESTRLNQLYQDYQSQVGSPWDPSAIHPTTTKELQSMMPDYARNVHTTNNAAVKTGQVYQMGGNSTVYTNETAARNAMCIGENTVYSWNGVSKNCN